jgi:Ca2+-binding EF-hand superfamily protein
MDDNRNHKLDLAEFSKAMQDYGLGYNKEEVQELFNAFDKDHSGQIDFDEFLEKLRV